MAFLTEPEPPRGAPQEIMPGVRRLVAQNPSLMTYHGTNTYLIDHPDGLIVLDPGPEDAAHTAAILRATDGKIGRIVLSHSHHDHLGGLPALRDATGAPTYGYRHCAVDHFTPDIALDDGDTVSGLTAIFTPGHAADHLCFAMPGGVLFSADHVMGWSTSIVSPPGGNMADYFTSLSRLLARDDAIYLAGHGPMLRDPHPYVRDLLAHRIAREQAILTALQAGPSGATALMEKLYSKLHPTLRRAAERNVVGHLEKLESEGRARRQGDIFQAV